MTTRNILVFGVRDLKIQAVATDPEGNNPMTYPNVAGSIISIHGINNANLTLEQEEVEARGDDVVQGIVATPANVRLDLGNAQLNLDAMGVLFGGAKTDVSPDEIFTMDGRTFGQYFRAEFIALTDDGKQFKVEIAKMKASQSTAPFADKQFASPTFQARGVPPKGKGASATPMLKMTYTYG